MHSVIVVTSWWSNCLALECLHRLTKFTYGRPLYVMQAGKSDAQMERFRRFLPAGVTELHYPQHLLADDSAMREYLAIKALHAEDGAWFIDHDTFICSPAESWFSETDRYLAQANICLCTGIPRQGPGLTQPAYWLSPNRWPPGLSSFHPVPFTPKSHVRRPDLHRHTAELAIPIKDTLVQVAEDLQALGKAGTFPLDEKAASHHPLSPFPAHRHLGGLHLYTGELNILSPEYLRWMQLTVSSFDKFFSDCSPEWRSIEDPELLKRHHEFACFLGYRTQDQSL